MKAIELRFKQFTDAETPPFTCSSCGNRSPGFQRYFAEIEIAPNAHFMIIVCDTVCMKNFMVHPSSDAYIIGNMKRMIQLHRKQA